MLLLVAACGGDSSDTTGPTTPDSGAETTVVTTTTAAPTTTTASTTTIAGATTTAAATSTTAPPAPTTTTLAPVTVTSTTADATNPIFEITVANGEVEGPTRASVRLGDVFIVRVVADVAEEVHLHGYDRFGDVAPGMPAVIEVEALIPGVFEVELEGSGLELLLIEVS